MIQHKVNMDNEGYFHFYSYESNRLDISSYLKKLRELDYQIFHFFYLI